MLAFPSGDLDVRIDWDRSILEQAYAQAREGSTVRDDGRWGGGTISSSPLSKLDATVTQDGVSTSHRGEFFFARIELFVSKFIRNLGSSLNRAIIALPRLVCS